MTSPGLTRQNQWLIATELWQLSLAAVRCTHAGAVLCLSGRLRGRSSAYSLTAVTEIILLRSLPRSRDVASRILPTPAGWGRRFHQTGEVAVWLYIDPEFPRLGFPFGPLFLSSE